MRKDTFKTNNMKKQESKKDKENIIMNTPCLSLKEIEEIYYEHTNNFFTKKLRAITKNKLKL